MLRTLIEKLSHYNTGFIVGLSTIVILILIYLIVRSFQDRDSENQIQTFAATPKSKKSEKKETVATESAAPAAPAANPIDASPLDDLDNLDDLVGPSDVAAAGGAKKEDMLVGEAEITGQAPSAKSAEVSAAQKAELNQALSEKEKVIGDLKNEISLLQEKMKTIPDTGAMEKKISELQDKLAEYEIIEDDIANLSFYKAENAKLKDELAKLQGVAPEVMIPDPGAPATSAASASAAVPEVDIPPPADFDIPAAAQAVPTESSSAGVMDEFKDAIDQKDKLEQSIASTPSTGAPVVPPAEADIMKEFENVVQKELAGGVPSTEAPKEVASTEAEKNSAVDEIDSNKLMNEMETLAQAPTPEEKDDGKDSSQKLIEEFENFVNKV